MLVENGENAVATDTQKKPNDPQAEEQGDQTKASKPRRPKLPTREKFDLFVKKANNGDRKAQAWLRRVLDAHPALWERAGDLAMHAQLSLINLISKGEWLLGESMKRSLAELRSSLESPSSTPLEKLSVERLVAAWANLYYVETVCLGDKGDLAERRYWLKKQDLAHRQYLAATKSLMLVQNLVARPTPAPPLAATSRRQMAGPSAPPGGNGSAGNGYEGSSPVPAFGADNYADQQVGFGNGQSTNRIAALVGAGS